MLTDRPNILIVTTDQQRIDSLSCYGSNFTYTPNIDRLATEGERLDRAYCTNLVCTPREPRSSPARQVSRHGAWNVCVHCPEGEWMISHILAEAGYRTHYVGKAHFQASCTISIEIPPKRSTAGMTLPTPQKRQCC